MKNQLITCINSLVPDDLPAAEALARASMAFPQADCPVRHHFADGIYIRELFMPAGIVAVGHHQKHAVMNVMVQGKVSLLKDDGTIVELNAPQTFVGKPGRKIGYIHENVIWLNVFPNPDNERDVEKLEARWLEKSEAFQATARQQKWIEWQSRAVDRKDYHKLLAELQTTEEDVRRIVDDENDQIPFLDDTVTITVRPSPIEGRGLFATTNIEAGTIIALGRVSGKRTPAGRYTNHSLNPNAEMVAVENGDIVLRALKPIFGCRGGLDGDEITVDYRQALQTAKLAAVLSQPLIASGGSPVALAAER